MIKYVDELVRLLSKIVNTMCGSKTAKCEIVIIGTGFVIIAITGNTKMKQNRNREQSTIHYK